MQVSKIEELTVSEVEQVNGGGSWFGALILGTIIGEVWGDFKSNPSSYGSRYSNMNNMHAKY
ncbi:hypothetical protein CXF83_00565 [Shewanella sp. Choline-02u-19]|jgi:hypothetical protein|uniref:hypothetical protein n=1 Tax=unclassified Shewanella TaxID=196818 RepID=UPI000C339C7E|nr:MULTISPECIES: hypothetical protein [unclassified Shewanella]PKG58526.1 hypothetical protein CXF82_04245 [Shewanella sp. GutDb-MelDb]PKH56022.1 hypothetical protein CXF84_15260 [Shewanella sp. Bg11-22]PKI30611.1 hypothetical protein CXF83_00565 [Shewanella sp. Choline-02u-19]